MPAPSAATRCRMRMHLAGLPLRPTSTPKSPNVSICAPKRTTEQMDANEFLSRSSGAGYYGIAARTVGAQDAGLWRGGGLSGQTMESDSAKLQDLCDRFVSSWMRGEPFQIDQMLSAVAPTQRARLLTTLLQCEVRLRRAQGESPQADEYLRRFPDDQSIIERHFETDFAADDAVDSTALHTVRDDGVYLANQEPVSSHIGRFRLEERIGRGGFAEVWRAYDPELERSVAIKFPRRDRVVPESSINRFLDEARKAARMDFPGVVPVYDVGHEDGYGYIVSELVPGGTLQQYLRDHDLTIVESVRLVAQIAETLQRMHLKDVVHRDIKPHNILMDRDSVPVITDLGLAVTETEMLMETSGTFGTWGYMSPEQVQGQSNQVDSRSDVYSLGVIFYQLLVKRLPFLARSPTEYRIQVLNREPRPLRTLDQSIPRELDELCLRCLSRRPADRPPTALTLAEDLRAWLGSVEQRPRPHPRSPLHWLVHRPWLFLTACALLAGVVPLTNALYQDWENKRPENATMTRNNDNRADDDRFVTDWQPRNLDGLERGTWHPVLQPPLGVLLWNLDAETSDRRLLPDESALVVACRSTALFSVGSTQSQDYQLKVDLHKIAGDGHFGLILGFCKQDKSEHHGFQAIVVKLISTGQFSKRCTVVRRRCALLYSSPGRANEVHEPVHTEVDVSYTGSQKSELEIHIVSGRLASVSWNGDELPELADVPDLDASQDSWTGQLGVVNSVGHTRFENLSFRNNQRKKNDISENSPQ